jgi:catechol 2,3-dioxygenase-like lactoylglutathione lyase family enzyme|tara:strand:- start:1773 stop:2315 length:543 start_codon:yes stop_codon:yes gene_type:complete
MNIKRIHHVAYRCHNAKETVEFYQYLLDMEFLLVFAEDNVPSTKEPNPYMHVFLDAGMGNVLAFFELPNSPKMGRDTNTPEWVQHIAFEVSDMDALLATKAKLEAADIDVLGPIDHTMFKSIYFFDPNGHRLELAVNRPISKEDLEKVKDLAPIMLEEWDRTKRPPKHTAWLHEKELSNI